MILKGIKLLFTILFIPMSINAQKIENLRFEQVGKQIIIYYDLTGTQQGQIYDVRVFRSNDGGNTFIGPLQKVTGEVGNNISGGTGKKVIWDVLSEIDKLEGDVLFEIRIKNYSQESVLKIGQMFQGGIIAYIFHSGDPGFVAGETHGIIAATKDQSSDLDWYNGSYIKTGATGTRLGSGYVNTLKIVNKLGIGNYAAKLCYDLILGGYSDWFLPSKDELNKLYLNKEEIGGFTSNFYWSSSEVKYINTYAWWQNFSHGYQRSSYRSGPFCIRAIRTF